MTETYSLWLYGSVARGDADSASDIDVLLIGNREPADWRNYIPSGNASLATLSRYSWPEFDAMAARGSLFLRHIRADGKHIGGSKVAATHICMQLAEMPPYRDVARDIRGFEYFYRELMSCESDDSTLAFDLRSVTAAIRHASILGCYLLRDEVFSRYEPVRRFAKQIPEIQEADVSFFIESYDSVRRPLYKSDRLARQRLNRLQHLLGKIVVGLTRHE